MRRKETVQCAAVVCRDGKRGGMYAHHSTAGSGILERKRQLKRAAKICAYRALSAHFKEALPWGSLTGVRPTRLLRDSEALWGEAGAKALFLNEFDVQPDKYALAKAILTAQEGLVSRSAGHRRLHRHPVLRDALRVLLVRVVYAGRV